MKRLAQAFLFAALLAAVALALPDQAQAYTWRTVTVDAAGDAGQFTCIAVDGNGDPMISYYDDTNEDLKFAICDLSATPNSNCDQQDDWSLVTVDAAGWAGLWTSIAVDPNGDPMISYCDFLPNYHLRFAICDLSASTNGNCNQEDDWSLVTVDAAGSRGSWTSIAVDANGDPMISYHDAGNADLKFAICDVSASVNGNCDEPGDWTTATVDAAGWVGEYSSIAVHANGDPMMSYLDSHANYDLRFAICDRAASANGNCNQTTDWSTVTVDAEGTVGRYTSIALDANGDPMISYHDDTNEDLKFATCDLSASANGKCDQSTDWSTVTVDAAASSGPCATSIALAVNDDPIISYYDYHPAEATAEKARATSSTPTPTPTLPPQIWDLRFAICDLSQSTNGNCDQTTDWSTETVDATGSIGQCTSMAVDVNGHPVISYHHANFALKFATAAPPRAVGGIAELPHVSDPSAPNYVALAGLAAAALLALSAGGWYARRRWLS